MARRRTVFLRVRPRSTRRLRLSNGDGVDDLLIGALGADPNGDNSGASYLVFGASEVGSSGTLELS